jgi:hypothetical protein
VFIPLPMPLRICSSGENQDVTLRTPSSRVYASLLNLSLDRFDERCRFDLGMFKQLGRRNTWER